MGTLPLATPGPRTAMPWPWALAYLAAYVALDWASYIRPLHGLNITPWNPQTALAVGLLAVHPRRIDLVLAGLLLSEALVRGLSGQWLAAVLASTALAACLAAAAAALRRRVDFEQPLAGTGQLGWFVAICVFASALFALVYVLAFAAFGLGDLSAGAIARYLVGDAVGLVVVLPLMMLLMQATGRAALSATLASPSWWFACLATCAALWLVFGRGEQDYFKYFYVLLLPVAWSATRFGLAGAVLSSAATQLGLILATQLALRQELAVFELQALMAATTLMGLLLGVVVDERSRSAQELRRSLRFAAAGQMAAALAHELSQPLTALNNYAQACAAVAQGRPASTGEKDSQIADIARSISQESQRAGTIIRRLRDFFGTGAVSMQLAPVEASVRDAVQAHAQFAERMGVGLDADVAPGLPSVWMDTVQMAVVLRNLLTNAIESAAGAGREVRQVTVTARLDDASGGVVVQVSDTGPGVDAGRIQQLFEPADSSKPGGMGVGLSICRAIVEAHGGKLWAQPGPQGNFFFSLPAHPHGTRDSHAS